ncbi:MAG TPA: 50S ribosomal protein L11 methyltransferase [Candidatus Gastranaerophilaceae bacterium]|nr:50S ribosomal protein L11 methyltransferase [Candidatus Gastranaerophilaceae bacterium]
MDNYYELKIKINPEASEIVSNICFENFECEGVILAEETYKDLELVSTTEGILKAFLKSDKNIKSVLQKNRNLLLKRGFSNKDLGCWDFEIIKIENQDWSKKWKENWDVTHVSDKISVVPSWIKYESKPEETVISLDPGSAFGTGTHPTTQLCMRAIEKYLKINDEMADIGTGSGILAICAIKFGAISAYGCDNDETVIHTAQNNSENNAVSNKCHFEYNTAGRIKNKFDFITANILHNVLADIMVDLKVLMKDNATLVLSGILNEKKDIVLDSIAKHGLELIEQTQQENWVALTVRKK